MTWRRSTQPIGLPVQLFTAGVFAPLFLVGSMSVAETDVAAQQRRIHEWLAAAAAAMSAMGGATAQGGASSAQTELRPRRRRKALRAALRAPSCRAPRHPQAFSAPTTT
mmetsp:Transcript_49221/g.151975  ORF Transcript_49221/g.151975 Transcript_49221/m.151975 type:complete len:109 (-) Transcript_49221:852-1178(-)